MSRTADLEKGQSEPAVPASSQSQCCEKKGGGTVSDFKRRQRYDVWILVSKTDVLGHLRNYYC